MRALGAAVVVLAGLASLGGGGDTGDRERLVAALLASSSLEQDARALNDRISGRPTGSEANARAVAWAEERFRSAGVQVHREPFTVPARWLERSAHATVRAEGLSFPSPVAAMPFSVGTPADGVTAPLVDGGRGTPDDFARLGASARGAFLLIEQDQLRDIDGLFQEYIDAAAIESRAFAAGVAGVVYMASRPPGILYRHNVAIGPANTRPMLVMEREHALRAMRLLRDGTPLTLTATLDIDSGGSFQSDNIVAEIPGITRPDEIVLMGAHLDSWDLGGGMLDNGANVALLIDLARQMQRLALRPARTIRLVLWNGEEQGMFGSFGYVRAHRAELDRVALAGSVDTGCGRITGWMTGGRPDVRALVDRLLAPAAGLGPFVQLDVPISGTDHFDFLLEGVPNVVANQEPASYGPNYHASSDQFDQCDLREQRFNAASVAALVWAAAADDSRLPRQGRSEVEKLIEGTDLGAQMKAFALYDAWTSGARGRARQ
jgi:hypothetical protein